MAHKKATLYVLPSGNSLRVLGDDFSLFDKDGEEVHIKKLTTQKKLLLKRLLKSTNQLVGYSELFEFYSEVLYLGKSDLSKVTKMVGGIDKKISKYIVATPNEGYTIEVKETKAILVDTSLYASVVMPATVKDTCRVQTSYPIYTHRMGELAGDYIGFYLDRHGSGSLFGIYMHIDNCGSEQAPDMRVHAILGVQSDEVLFGKKIADVFSVKQEDYSLKFAQFREELVGKNKECFIGTGTIIPHKAIVEITFGAITDEEWHIFVDLQGYLADTRPKEHDTDKYRGGLGLAFAFWSEFGDTCFRFAFVRNSLRSPALSLNSESIREKLKITVHGQGVDWKPVELSSQLDKGWYNWFMKEYQTYNALHSE